MGSVGIRHVHLLVADHERAATFYREAFGMEERFRDGPIVFLGTPGGPDRWADAIDAAVRRVQDAGGELLRRGEHAPGVPYAYVGDVDGYAIEI